MARRLVFSCLVCVPALMTAAAPSGPAVSAFAQSPEGSKCDARVAYSGNLPAQIYSTPQSAGAFRSQPAFAQAPGIPQTKPASEDPRTDPAMRATVLIEVGDATDRVMGQGTGFVARADGLIVTNFHVIREAHSVRVRLHNGDVYDDVALVASDPRKDLAVLRVKAIKLAILELGDSDGVQIGQEVRAVGNPRGLENSVSTGIVSAWRAAADIPGGGEGFRLIQVTTPISPGSSGGPLLDREGYVIGVTSASLPGGQNLNFAVPSNYVTPLLANSTEKQFARAAFDSPRAGGVGENQSAAAVKAVENAEKILATARTAFVLDATGRGLADVVNDFLAQWGKYVLVLQPPADLIFAIRIGGDGRTEYLEVYDGQSRALLERLSTGLSIWRGTRWWARGETGGLMAEFQRKRQATQTAAALPPPVVVPPQSGTVVITSTPSGANVSIDWKSAGLTPLTVTLPAGGHVIRVSLTGYVDWVRGVPVNGPAKTEVAAILEKRQ
jgi:S1-C subfamily serine protease